MAHHIEHGMISFTAETPWHELGTRVVPGSTPEEMLKAAKLDWTVALRPLSVSTRDIDPVTNVYTDNWRLHPMGQFKAVIREDTHECFAVPTKRYNPVQNLEIARFFADYADATSCELQVVGGLDGGRKVWALAKVAADYVVTAPDKGLCSSEETDTQLGYVMLATSHDGSLRTIAMGTSIYVVCWNTMSAALGRAFDMTGGRAGKLKTGAKAVFALKHSSKFDDAAKREAIQTVGLVKEQLESTHVMAEQFSRVSLDARGRIEFVRRLIGGETVLEQIANDQLAMQSGASLLDSIVDAVDTSKGPEDSRLGKQIIDSILTSPGSHLPSRMDTLWGAVNGVTHYVDHERGRTTDSTLNQAWFGQGAQMKADAVRVAYDMAGVR